MANRYWVGGTGTWDTTSTTNWSASSGGASGASVPTAADSVFFDQAGTYAVTVDQNITVTCLDLTVSAGTVTFAINASPTVAISGSMTLIAGTTWLAQNATTLFNATTTGKTITTNGVTIQGAVYFNGVGGGWTLGSALTVGLDLFISAGTISTSANNYSLSVLRQLRVQGGTLTLNASTVTLASSGTALLYLSGTVNAGTSTINLTSPSGVFTGGSQTYYNVSFTSTAITNAGISGNIFNNLTITGRTTQGLGIFFLLSDITVNGTFTISAGTDATYRVFVKSNTAGTSRTLTCAAVSLTDVDFQDITAAGVASPFTGTRLGNCKGNSNITFPTGVNKYWNLAAGGNWGGAIGWATTGGGVPAINNFPLAQDTAIFQSTGLNSGATITVNSSYNIGAIDMSARTANTMTLATGTTTPTIYGNWINGTGTTLTGTGQITFSARGAQSVTSAGVTFTQQLNIASLSGTVTLQDALTTSSALAGAFTLTNGTLNLNGKTLTLSASATATFLTAAGTKDLTFNGGTLSIASSGATAFNNANPTNFTTTAGTGTGTITLTSASAKTFVGGGSTFNCTLDQGGAGALTITGANTFGNITNTYGATGATSIIFPASTTTTVTNFTASGTAGKLLTIDSSVNGTRFTLSKSSGTVNANYLSIQDSAATGGATWNAGANSVDGGNNTGWIFSTTGGKFLMFFM